MFVNKGTENLVKSGSKKQTSHTASDTHIKERENESENRERKNSKDLPSYT